MGILASLPRAQNDQSVRECVCLAMGTVSPTTVRVERRRAARHAFPYPVGLTPLDEHGKVLVDDKFVVIAKHLSESGIDFYHREPVPNRRVIATLPCGPERSVSLLLELTWCRFGSHTWYENGGRFRNRCETPVDWLAQRWAS